MQITDFFENFTQAFNEHNVDELSRQYYVPAIVMVGTEKLIFTDREQIRQYVEEYMQDYQTQGIDYVELEMQQVMKLADDIIFCKIMWHFYDANDQMQLTCPISYTLQMQNNSVTHIIAVVRDKNIPVKNEPR